MQRFGELQKVILSNQSDGIYVSIIPSHGAALNGLSLDKNGKKHDLVLGAENYNHFINRSIPYYMGLKLFPFPNRVSKGQYTLDEMSYQLPLNDPGLDNSLHGLVFDKKFEIINQEANEDRGSVTLSYEAHQNNLSFPFSYKLQLIYILENNGLTVETIIYNLSDRPMPYGDGWHPYISTGTPVDQLELQIPSKEYLCVDDQQIPTGEINPMPDFVSPRLIGNQSFNQCFVIPEKIPTSSTIIYDRSKNIEIEVWQDTSSGKYNYVQLYIPPDRMSIAIEPMTCAPDAINNQIGLQYLDPGSVHRMTYGIKLK